MILPLQAAPESTGTMIVMFMAVMLNRFVRGLILTYDLSGKLQVGSIAVIGVLFIGILSSINLLHICCRLLHGLSTWQEQFYYTMVITSPT
jgi:hypothetical protein